MSRNRWSWLNRLAMEPPFRIVARAALKYLNPSIETRALWDLSKRPAYLIGILAAAEQAKRQNISEICAVEFGVAGGDGLVVMQEDAAAVEQATGVQIRVFGFDAGASGLPDFIGDYRDHPDAWMPGDYPMDEAALRDRLNDRTSLVLGNVKNTVPTFFTEHQPPPIGFVSIDVDLYSSSRDALAVFLATNRKMLWHTPVYFDDIEFFFNHKFAGELLSIDEFNDISEYVKIDKWYGMRNGRPFPERTYFDKFYIAHDIEAISAVQLNRTKSELPLSE